VFKAHRLFYHSTLGLRVIKKKKEGTFWVVVQGLDSAVGGLIHCLDLVCLGFRFQGLGFRV